MNYQKKNLFSFAVVVLGMPFVAFGMDYPEKQLPEVERENPKTEYQKTLELHREIRGPGKVESVTPDQVAVLRRLGYEDDAIKRIGLSGKAAVQSLIEADEKKKLEDSRGDIERLQKEAGLSKKEAEAIVLKKAEAMGMTVEQVIAAKKIPQPNAWSRIKEVYSGIIDKLKPVPAKKIDLLSGQGDVPQKTKREVLEQSASEREALSKKGEEAIGKVKMAEANIEFEANQKNPRGVLRELAIKIAALNIISKASGVIRAREEQVKIALESSEFEKLSKEDQRKLREANRLISETDPEKLKKDQEAAKSAYAKQLRIMQNMIKEEVAQLVSKLKIERKAADKAKKEAYAAQKTANKIQKEATSESGIYKSLRAVAKAKEASRKATDAAAKVAELITARDAAIAEQMRLKTEIDEAKNLRERSEI
ncbi:MAG: hypothetical protein V1646_03710 [bacterium]